MCNYFLNYLIAFDPQVYREIKLITVTLITLYIVCAVAWWVLSTMREFSTVGGYHEYHGGYLEYRWGVQYHGDIMINVGIS